MTLDRGPERSGSANFRPNRYAAVENLVDPGPHLQLIDLRHAHLGLAAPIPCDTGGAVVRAQPPLIVGSEDLRPRELLGDIKGRVESRGLD
jgi:hypothetical protein